MDSELGRGTAFTIYFPAVDAPLTAIIPPDIREAEGQGEIILLVEDDVALRESIFSYLELHGYEVLEAPNGAQALQLARQHEGLIRALITDMVLPKMSGAELAQEIARTSPKMATLYMSGYTDRALTDYDPAIPIAEFLQKPFSLHTLLQKLREMIAR